MRQFIPPVGLYVGNLDKNISTDMLYSFFHSYNVIKIKHPYNKEKGAYKNYAFVFFKNLAMA